LLVTRFFLLNQNLTPLRKRRKRELSWKSGGAGQSKEKGWLLRGTRTETIGIGR